MTLVLFAVFGSAAVAGALGVVLSANPVHSALSLVLTLVSVGVLFLMQDAQLVFAVQIIVYAGAIVVLFLFVIMLLGVDRLEALTERLRFQRPAAVAIGLVLLAEVLFLAGHEWATGAPAGGDRSITGGDLGPNVERVARSLFTDFLWPFELTAVLLVLAVVGSVVLARRSGQRPVDAADPVAADPVAGEAGGR